MAHFVNLGKQCSSGVGVGDDARVPSSPLLLVFSTE
jgi:hypothetical protein